MLALSDTQVDHIVLVSRPLQPHERAAFLAKLFDDLLNRREAIGEGELGRLLRELQHRHFTPPGETKGASEQVTIRLANEGVPVRVIARAVQVPSENVREALKTAREDGYLIELPGEDWPIRRTTAHDRPTLETAVRRVFALRPTQVAMLVLLLMNDEVSLERLAACGSRNAAFATIRVALYRLRLALAPLKLEIVTLHAFGYYMPQRRRAQDLILAKAAQAA